MEELIKLEDKFWRADAEFYSRMLTESCLMVFPAPAGVLKRVQIIEAVSIAPRWRAVHFEDVSTVKLEPGLVILIYKARAQRGEDDTLYVTLASSIYVRRQNIWRLAFHQQTPITGE